jgi:tetratricopeptide (TPR) repeat protein
LGDGGWKKTETGSETGAGMIPSSVRILVQVAIVALGVGVVLAARRSRHAGLVAVICGVVGTLPGVVATGNSVSLLFTPNPAPEWLLTWFGYEGPLERWGYFWLFAVGAWHAMVYMPAVCASVLGVVVFRRPRPHRRRAIGVVAAGLAALAVALSVAPDCVSRVVDNRECLRARKEVAAHPDSAMRRNEYAGWLRATGQMPAALGQAQLALRLDKTDDPEYLRTEGNVLLAMGRWAEALGPLQAAYERRANYERNLRALFAVTHTTPLYWPPTPEGQEQHIRRMVSFETWRLASSYAWCLDLLARVPEAARVLQETADRYPDGFHRHAYRFALLARAAGMESELAAKMSELRVRDPDEARWVEESALRKYPTAADALAELERERKWEARRSR